MKNSLRTLIASIIKAIGFNPGEKDIVKVEHGVASIKWSIDDRYHDEAFLLKLS